MAEPSDGSTMTSDTKMSEPSGDQSSVRIPSTGGMQMFHTMYPALIPNFSIMNENHEHSNRGAGLYAVPVLPFGGGQIPGTLIPLSYTVPTATSSENGTSGQENEPAVNQGDIPQQQGGPEGLPRVRQVQIAINLDLLLLLKLMVVVYLFHQDGSRLRLAVLIFLASIVYLYQTGYLNPIMRRLKRFLNVVPQPARPPRDALPADDVNLGNENAVLAERGQEGDRVAEAENDNQAVGDENMQGVDNQPGEEAAGAQRNANPLWVIMKEIQIFVIGFITSLLPGFQHLD